MSDCSAPETEEVVRIYETGLAHFDDDTLIHRYIELRDWLKVEGEKNAALFEEKVGAFRAEMPAIESELHRRLIERKAQSGSSAHGTFYREKTLSLRVSDQAAFLTYVFDNCATGLIAAAANKTAVKEFQDMHKCNPPGVETTWIETVKVRRK